MNGNSAILPSGINGDLYLWYLNNLLSTMNTLPTTPLWFVTIEGIPEKDVLKQYLNKEPAPRSSWNNYEKLSKSPSEKHCIIFAQGVDLPGDGIGANRTGVDNSGYIKGFTGSGRNDLNPLGITFLETNFSFTDLLLRPWTIAAGYASLKNSGIKATNITCHLMMRSGSTINNNTLNLIPNKNPPGSALTTYSSNTTQFNTQTYAGDNAGRIGVIKESEQSFKTIETLGEMIADGKDVLNSITNPFAKSDKYKFRPNYTPEKTPPAEAKGLQYKTNRSLKSPGSQPLNEYAQNAGYIILRKSYTFHNVCPVSIDNIQYDYTDKVIQRQVQFAYEYYTIDDNPDASSEIKIDTLALDKINQLTRGSMEYKNNSIIDLNKNTPDHITREAPLVPTDLSLAGKILGWAKDTLDDQANSLLTNAGRIGLNGIDDAMHKVTGAISGALGSGVSSVLNKLDGLVEDAKDSLFGKPDKNEDTAKSFNNINKNIKGIDTVKGNAIPVQVVNIKSEDTPVFQLTREPRQSLINDINNGSNSAKTTLKDSTDTPLHFPGPFGQNVKINENDYGNTHTGMPRQQKNIQSNDVVNGVTLKNQEISIKDNDAINGKNIPMQIISIDNNDSINGKVVPNQIVNINDSDIINKRTRSQIVNIDNNDSIGEHTQSQEVIINESQITHKSQPVEVEKNDSTNH